MSRQAVAHYRYDVVIIGGGAAAALAALAATRAGAKVALVTKESSLVGGATIMAAGGTSVTVSPGDTPDIFLADIMKAGAGLNDPILASMVAAGSMEALLDLEAYGFLLDRKDGRTLRTIKQGEGHAFPRGYLDRREALGFCHALAAELMGRDIAVFAETTAARLFVREGRAAGVLAFSLATGQYIAIGAGAVVLATGGLGALYEVTTNSAVLTGDGYAMAWDCGAELVDMEMVQFLPLAFPYPKSRRGKIIGMCSHFGRGVKLYNGLGERYMARYDAERLEFTTRDTGARANYTEIREGRGNRNGAIIVDTVEHDPAIRLRWKTSLPHHYAMFRQVFGEEAADWKRPFEAIPSQHFFMGGVRIDENCRTTVDGLFAVGEVAGGVHGANRLSGTAFTELFVFGPLAGKKAAELSASGPSVPLDAAEVERAADGIEAMLTRTGKGVRPFELKEAIRGIMWDSLGPVRDGVGMERALAALEDMADDVRGRMVLGSPVRRYNREMMEAVELPLMVRCALLVARSALARTESRGSHYRTDFPGRDDGEWLKSIILSKDERGGGTMGYRQVPRGRKP